MLLGMKRIFYFHPTVMTGNFQRRVISQKGITSPLFIILRTFQHITMAADILQNPHDLYGCNRICIQLPG